MLHVTRSSRYDALVEMRARGRRRVGPLRVFAKWHRISRILMLNSRWPLRLHCRDRRGPKLHACRALRIAEAKARNSVSISRRIALLLTRIIIVRVLADLYSPLSDRYFLSPRNRTLPSRREFLAASAKAPSPSPDWQWPEKCEGVGN